MRPLLDAVRRFGVRLTAWTERVVPDAWVLCMALTVLAFGLAVLGAGAGPGEAVLAWGGGVWSLLALAMQFTIAMVAAHACVSAPVTFRALDRLAGLPDPERPLQAVALAGGFSLATGYLNWALCLVACALFVPFVVRRNPRADVRVIVAASCLGLGTVWHGGLSASAPLLLATPGNPLLVPATGAPLVDRLFPVTETLLSPFNLAYVAVIATTGLAAILALHPRSGAVTLSPAEVDAILPRPPPPLAEASSFADRVNGWRGWCWLAALLFALPLGHGFVTRGVGATWTINAYNEVFLIVALLLHGRPLSFLQACRQGLDAAWGIVVQFPFYAGIFGLMTGTALGTWLGSLFVRVASAETFPFLVYVYSATMNLFVPSGGSKWLIEAPYLLPAAQELGVSVTTTLFAYAYGDSTTNLIQPFFAIPILAVTRLRFGEVVGYTLLVAIACFVVTGVAMFLIPPRL